MCFKTCVSTGVWSWLGFSSSDPASRVTCQNADEIKRLEKGYESNLKIGGYVLKQQGEFEMATSGFFSGLV